MTLRDYIKMSVWFMATMTGLLLAFCGTTVGTQIMGAVIAAAAIAIFVYTGEFAEIESKLRDDT